MARIKEEDLRLNIIVNGDNGRKEMLDLKDSINAASESLRNLRRRAREMRQQNQTSSAGYKALQNEIKSTSKTLSEHKARYAELEKQMDVTKMTTAELRKRINNLRGVLDSADPGTATWMKYNSELKRTRQRLAELVSQSLATDKTLCGVATRLNQYMQSTIGIFLHVRSGLSTIQQATDRFAEYDEALVDAMKTTNLTREEIEELSERLKGMDTRTAQNELLSLARIGGKLGISGIDDLEGFVNAADKINVSLSEDLGGNAEAAIEAIGKMVDIFNLSGEFGLEQAMLKVGSAVNSLGMASTANEGYIVDFTKRLAGIAPNADISIDKILGLAATLDKYGQTSEMSSTAIGQTIMAMFSRTETFAKIAGTSLAEFSQLLKTDVNEAFIRVLEGLKGSDGSLASIVANMNEMHLDGQRASQVLGTLSKNTEELRNQQLLAAEAFDEGNSILAEFDTKNSSVTAVLEKQRKEVTEQVVAIGQQLMPVVNFAMDAAEVGMKTLAGLVKLLMENKAVVIALTAAVMAYNVAKRVEKTLTNLSLVKLSIQAYAKVAQQMGNAAKGALLWNTAKKVLTISLRNARVAVSGFFKAIKTGMGPIGWITMALEAVVAVVGLLVRRHREATKAQRELAESNKKLSLSYTDTLGKMQRERDELDYLAERVRRAKEGTEERAAAIKLINDRYGEYLPALLTEKSGNEDVAAALRAVNEQLERKIRLQARESEEQRLYEERMEKVKAAVEEYAAIYEKINGKGMTPLLKTNLAEAVVQYANTRTNPAADNPSRMRASAWLANALEAIGLNSGTGIKKTLEVSKQLDVYVASALEQRRMLDAYYGSMDELTPPPSGIGTGTEEVGTAGGTGGTSVTVTGGTSSGRGSGKWSLASDREYQEQLLALKKRYLDGDIATQGEYNALAEQLEIDTLKRRLENTELSGEEHLELESQLQDRLIDRKEDAVEQEERIEAEKRKIAEDGLQVIRDVENDKLAEEERRYQEQRQKFAGNAAVLEALERQHRARVSRIHLDQFNDRMEQEERAHQLEKSSLQNRHTEELASFEGTGRELKALKRRQYEEMSALDLAYAQRLRGILDAVSELDGTVNVDFSGLSVEELTQMQQKLQDIIAKVNELEGKPAADSSSERASDSGASAAAGGSSFWNGAGGSLFGVSQDQWEQFFQNLADGKLGAEDLRTMLQGVGGMAQEAFKLASLWSQKQTALEQQQLKAYEKSNDKKKDALRNRLDAGLMTEAQYNAEVERMDAEYDAFQEELQLKQAKRNKQMQLTQAIINTALGVTMTLAQWGIPWGLIPAGIMAAMGAAEIALIASTPITTGYAEGGLVGPDGKPIDVSRSQDGRRFKARLSPEKRGFISSPTVLVSENGQEYVIPSEGLDNPTLLPFINTLETARRNGRLKDLDFGAVFPPSVAGRASGGPVSGLTVPQNGTAVKATVPDDREMKQIMKQLLRRLENPIEARVSMLGRNGIVEQTDRCNRMRRRNGQL